MKITIFITSILFIVATSCSSGYEKSPEDWSMEICKCAIEKGNDAKECHDKLDSLENYYSDDDFRLHDKATTLLGQDCGEFFLWMIDHPKK